MKTMDWLGKAIGLPDAFLFSGSQFGGGVIQGTASEVTLVAILAARHRASKRASLSGADVNVSKFVVYSSAQAHCSVEKAAIIAGVQYCPVQVAFDEQLSLTGDALAGLCGAACILIRDDGLV